MNKVNTLKINNVVGQLSLPDNPDVAELLWSKLRFREKGYFHSRLYQQKRWDGYREFFKKTTGRFPAGLLPEILVTLKYLNIDYVFQDNRNLFDFKYDSIDESFLQPHVECLRDYQVDLVNSYINNRRGIVTAPTAAGKSFVIAGAVKVLPDDCLTLVTTNQISLVRQIYDDLKELGIKDLGIIGGGKFDFNRITVSTVQSLKKISNELPKVQALIVDEVHQNMSKVPKKHFDSMTNASVRLAVSATAFKFGGTDHVQKWNVKGCFGPVLKSKSVDGEVTVSKLQDRGILSKSICTFYPVREPDLPYAIYQDAIKYGMAESLHFQDMVVKLAKSLRGRTLIFVDRLALGESLNERIKGSYWTSGRNDDDERKIVIDKLKSSKVDTVAIATQQIFNAGINVMVHNVINAAGGAAEHQITQRIGRGLRVADDKERLRYFDFTFYNNPYLLGHSRKRIKAISDNGHEVIIKDTFDL